MKITTDKKHIGSLTAEARTALAGSNENRIKFIKRKKFISYPRADVILAKLECLIREPKNIKMPFYLILGADNCGKTTVVREFLRRHPVTPASDCGCIKKKQPVVYIKAPKGPKEGELYNHILECLSVPLKRSNHPSQKAYDIYYHFCHVDVKVLIIDNFHVALHGPPMRRSAFMNAIKILSSKLRIPIVLLGQLEIIDAINTDIRISSDYLPMFFAKRTARKS